MKITCTEKEKYELINYGATLCAFIQKTSIVMKIMAVLNAKRNIMTGSMGKR